MSTVDIMNWSEPRVRHDAGPPIKNHTMTYHENLLYCFGGYDGRRNHSTLSIFSIHEQQWYPVQVVGQEEEDEEDNGDDDEDESDDDSNSSSINQGHAHDLYRRRTRSSSISLLSVSSSVDSTSRTPVHPSSFRVCGAPPPGRNGHTATLVKRKVGRRERLNPYDDTLFDFHNEDLDLFTEQTCIFIIGGWLGAGPLASADMYILDISNIYEFRWIAVDETLGSPPGPCNMHSADFVSSQNEIYIFRGGDGHAYLNDLHAIDCNTLTWRRVETCGAVPEPRANHSSALIEETNELVIFGGWNGRERLNDIHILDIATSTWSKPFVGGLLPHPRAGMTFTALHGRLYLYGGSGPSSKCFQDLHILERKDLAWLDVLHLETGRTLSIPSSLNEPLPAIVTSGTHRNSSANPSSSSITSVDRGPISLATVNESEATIARDQYSFKIGGGFQRIIEESVTENHGGKKASTYSGNPNDAENTSTIQVKGKGPGRRAGHTSTAVNRKIYFYGGSAGSEYLNDWTILDTDPIPQVVVTEPTSLDLLRRRLPFFVNEEDFADVVFLVEGKRVYSHQLILSLVSDCFRAMFTRGFIESTVEYPEIEIPNISYESFHAMIEYIYTGQAPKLTTIDHEIDLLSLADQFMLDHLKQDCERILIPRIDITSLGHLLHVSQKCNAPQLEAACRHYERNQGVV